MSDRPLTLLAPLKMSAPESGGPPLLAQYLASCGGTNFSRGKTGEKFGCGGDLNPRPLGYEPVTSTLLETTRSNNR